MRYGLDGGRPKTLEEVSVYNRSYAGACSADSDAIVEAIEGAA